MSATLTVDARKLERALKAFIGNTKLEAGKEMRVQARMLCLSLAKGTQPFGLDSGARKQGEKAVARDIGRVYKSPAGASVGISKLSTGGGKTSSQNAAQAGRAFSALVNSRFTGKGKKKRTMAARSQAQELLKRINSAPFVHTQLGSFDGGKANTAARFGKRKSVPKNQFVGLVVDKSSDLKKYYKEKMSHVGIMKSGWSSCAKLLGGLKGFPGWVTRHGGGGTVDDQSSKAVGAFSKPYVKITNKIPGIGNAISDSTIRRSIDIQLVKMMKRLGIIANYERKKAGFA
jgi:hypothetical protein